MGICPTCNLFADPDDPATVRTMHADLHAACFAEVCGKRASSPIVLRPRDEPLPGGPGPAGNRRPTPLGEAYDLSKLYRRFVNRKRPDEWNQDHFGYSSEWY
jgi:hypothetical protein